MPDLATALLSVKQETSDVKSFRFDTKGVFTNFQAGQFLKLTIPNVTNDPRGSSRFFSIASSPTEKDFLMIATKISQSPFKQALTALPVGQKVSIDGPFGKFTLTDDASKAHVFLGGGIGITPFRSMIKFATDERLPHRIVLLYSNRTPDDIVFKEDFDDVAKTNTNLTIVHALTRSTDQPVNNNATMQQYSNGGVAWETGRIDEKIIRKYVNDIPNAIFYICGPPSMVEALSGVVKAMGISEENIKTERFTGYA